MEVGVTKFEIQLFNKKLAWNDSFCIYKIKITLFL